MNRVQVLHIGLHGIACYDSYNGFIILSLLVYVIYFVQSGLSLSFMNGWLCSVLVQTCRDPEVKVLRVATPGTSFLFVPRYTLQSTVGPGDIEDTWTSPLYTVTP